MDSEGVNREGLPHIARGNTFAGPIGPTQERKIMPKLEEMKVPGIVVLVGLFAYHNGYLNFLFSEPSKAGLPKK